MSARPTEPWETGQRDAFRTRFGEDPDAYERTRPVAPAVVFDDVIRLAQLEPGSEIVEIGPGTGQATRPLAERGLHILGLEIDQRLAAAATRNLAAFPDVTVRATSFEDWPPGEATFDAVVACNSFHWLDPDVRFAKSAAVLKPQGHLVVMSTPVVVPADADRFWWDVQDDWAAAGSGRLDPAAQHPDLVEDLGAAIGASGSFEEPTTRRYRFDVTLTADEYIANLSTQSGVKTLGPEGARRLLALVRTRVDAHGGTLTIHHLAVLTVAQHAA